MSADQKKHRPERAECSASVSFTMHGLWAVVASIWVCSASSDSGICAPDQITLLINFMVSAL